MAISALGAEARSFSGSRRRDHHLGPRQRRIIDVTPGRVRQALEDGSSCCGRLPGRRPDTKDITTLGRGGSTPPRSRWPPR